MKSLTNASFLFCLLLLSRPAWGQSYTPDVVYQFSVPALLGAVTEAVKDAPNKEAVAQWGQQTSERLPEFLDDLTMVAATLSLQPLDSGDISVVQDFVTKWQNVIDTCPDCQDLVPLVTPVIETLLHNIPKVREARAGDTPFQNHYELFNQLRDMNPWGLGALFHTDPPPGSLSQLSVAESSREFTNAGIRSSFIKSRMTTRQINGETVFQEKIDNNQLAGVSFEPPTTSLIHESLDQLKQNGADPDVIERIEKLVALIDETLIADWKSGALDDFSYHYLYDRDPITNELVHTLHPLMKAPYNQTYQTTQFYPREYSWKSSAVPPAQRSGVFSRPAPDEKSQAEPAPATVIFEDIPPQWNDLTSDHIPQKIQKSHNEDAGPPSPVPPADKAINLWGLGILFPGVIYFLGSVVKGAYGEIARRV